MSETSETAEAPRPAAHEMQVGPTNAFDAKGVVRTVWALKCSCGFTGKAIDQSGIGREAKIHALEVQVAEVAQMVAGAYMALESMALVMREAGLEPPAEPNMPMPDVPVA